MDTIEQSIDNILNNRIGKRDAIQKLSNNLMDLDGLLQSDLLDIISTEYRAAYNDLRSNLNALRTRFGRDTINIVTVGRARQGKSRLLQTITGLDTTCIPDGGSLDCTAVKSVIVNTDSRKDAMVHFYDRGEFLKDIITPYYSVLKLKPVSTLAEFETDDRICNLSVTGGAIEYRKHLCNYQKNYQKYKELLGGGEKSIDHSDIRQYVAQDDIDGNREKYFNYFAVKSVEVFAKFPQEELGTITVVDLPGIGDTKLGIAKNIIKEIKENIDIVYFIKKPSATGDHLGKEYIDLYDRIEADIAPIPLSKCSYLVLNNDEANKKLCQDILKEMPKSGLQVTETKIVDVTDTAEVQQLLQNSLEGLTKNIDEIDRNLIDKAYKKIIELSSIIEKKIKNISLNIFDERSVQDKFDNVFKEWMKTLRYELTKHNDKLQDIVKKEEGNYQKEFDEYIGETRKNCEAKKERYKQGIADTMKRVAENKKGGKIEDEINKLRTDMAKEFFGLDDKLDEIMNSMKQEIVDILSEDNIGLSRVVRTGDDPKIMLENLEQAFREIKEDDIAKSLQNFREFRLLYRGIMHNKVRKIINQFLLPEMSGIDKPKEWEPEDIAMQLIEANYDDAIKKATNSLYEFNQEPDKTVASITEELIDGIAIPDDVDDAWRKLLGRNFIEIWPDVFKPLIEEEESSKNKEAIKNRSRELLSEMKTIGEELR